MVGIVLLGGSIWIPQSDREAGEDSWFWFKRTVEQVAANLAVDGWPMIAASMGALALVVTIVAFVGSSKWTVTSESKRHTLAEAAWALTLLASGIATWVSSAVFLMAVPLSQLSKAASGAGMDGESFGSFRDALSSQSRLLVLGMVGLGVLMSCRYADRALRAWIRVDDDDAVQELSALEQRLSERVSLRQVACRRRGEEWVSTRRTQMLATALTVGAAFAFAGAGALVNTGVRLIAGRPVNFLGQVVGLASFLLVYTVIVGTAVYAWRKSLWTASSDGQRSAKFWQRTRTRLWVVFVAAGVIPALVLWAFFSLDGPWGWGRAASAVIVMAAFAGVAVVLARYRGAYSWDDVAVRVAIEELTSGIDADRKRIADLESRA
ncbi:hypothetical protein ASF87_10335 [Microbacterium sp. Leaf161]|nr:hypothetical protein ASF87_10335 [Microbacterium sp. Leaf161]